MSNIRWTFLILALWCNGISCYAYQQRARIQVGHSGPVQQTVFSSDGRYLLTAAATPTAILWDARTGRCLRRFHGHSGGPLAFLDGAKGVLVDGIPYWVDSGERMVVQGDSVARAAESYVGSSVHAGGRKFVVASLDECSGFELRGRTLVRTTHHRAPGMLSVLALGFHDKHGPVAIVREAGTLSVHAVEAWKKLCNLEVSSWDSLQFSPCGRWVSVREWPDTGDARVNVTIFDIATGQACVNGHCIWNGDSPVWTANGDICALGIGTQEALVLKVSTGETMATFQSPQAILELGFVDDDRQLEARCATLALRFDLAVEKIAEISPAGMGVSLPEKRSAYSLAQPTPDGKSLLIGEYLIKQGEAAIQLGNGSSGFTPQLASLSPLGDRIVLRGVFPDAGRAIDACQLIDAKDGKQICELSGPRANPHRLVFDRSMKKAVTPFRNGWVVWDLEGTERKLHVLPKVDHNRQPLLRDTNRCRIQFSRNGRFVYTAGTGTALRIWDADTGQKVEKVEGSSGENVFDRGQSIVSPDEALGVSIVGLRGQRRLKAWNLDTGERASWLRKQSDIIQPESFAFSNDSRWLAIAFSNIPHRGNHAFELQLWDCKAMRLVHRIEGDDRSARTSVPPSVSFTPDGTKCIVNPRGRTLYVYSVADGQLVHPLEDRTKGDPRLDPHHRIKYLMADIQFSPDSTMAIAQYATEYTLIWDTVEGRLLHRIDDDNGNISAKERYQFSPDSSQIQCTYTRPFRILDTRSWETVKTFDDLSQTTEAFANQRWSSWHGRQVQSLAENEIRAMEQNLGIEIEDAERSADGDSVCLYPGDQSFYITNKDASKILRRYYILESGYSMVSIDDAGELDGDGDYFLAP